MNRNLDPDISQMQKTNEMFGTSHLVNPGWTAVQYRNEQICYESLTWRVKRSSGTAALESLAWSCVIAMAHDTAKNLSVLLHYLHVNTVELLTEEVNRMIVEVFGIRTGLNHFSKIYIGGGHLVHDKSRDYSPILAVRDVLSTYRPKLVYHTSTRTMSPWSRWLLDNQNGDIYWNSFDWQPRRPGYALKTNSWSTLLPKSPI